MMSDVKWYEPLMVPEVSAAWLFWWALRVENCGFSQGRHIRPATVGCEAAGMPSRVNLPVAKLVRAAPQAAPLPFWFWLLLFCVLSSSVLRLSLVSSFLSVCGLFC